MENNKQVKVGVAIIVRRKYGTDRCCILYDVLMGIRKGSHGAGTWSFPGGHVEFGESIEEAGKRELYEETGIDVPIDKFERMGYVDTIFKDQNRHYITLYLLVEWKKEYDYPKLMEPNKCEGWAWTNEKPSPLFEPIDNLKNSVWQGR
jgi:8-oxo-dGTP diphosphatase